MANRGRKRSTLRNTNDKGWTPMRLGLFIFIMFLLLLGFLWWIWPHVPWGNEPPPATGVPPVEDWQNAKTPKPIIYQRTYLAGATPTEASTDLDLYCFAQDPSTITPERLCFSKKDIVYDAIANLKYLPNGEKVDYVAGGVNIVDSTAATAAGYLCDWINTGRLGKRPDGKYHFYMLMWDGDALNNDTSATDPQTYYWQVVEMVEDQHFMSIDGNTTASSMGFEIRPEDPNALRRIATWSIGTVTTTATTLTWNVTLNPAGSSQGEVYDPDGKSPRVRMQLTLGSGMTFVSATYASSAANFSPVPGTTTQRWWDMQPCGAGQLIVTYSGTYASGSAITIYVEPEDGTGDPVKYTYTETDPRNTSVGSMAATASG